MQAQNGKLFDRNTVRNDARQSLADGSVTKDYPLVQASRFEGATSAQIHVLERKRQKAIFSRQTPNFVLEFHTTVALSLQSLKFTSMDEKTYRQRG